MFGLLSQEGHMGPEKEKQKIAQIGCLAAAVLGFVAQFAVPGLLPPDIQDQWRQLSTEVQVCLRVLLLSAPTAIVSIANLIDDVTEDPGKARTRDRLAENAERYQKQKAEEFEESQEHNNYGIY